MSTEGFSWNSLNDVYGPYYVEQFNGGDSININVNMMTPKEIVNKLDSFVIGQTIPKQLIAIAAHNRLLAMRNDVLGKISEQYYFDKNNVILVGSTGCGKTHIVKSLGEVVSLPVTVQDTTTFTSAGYHGRDVTQAINDLFLQAERIVNKLYKTDSMFSKHKSQLIKKYAEYGIIYLDEIDKVRKTENRGKDVNGAAVQEALLKLIEGVEVNVNTEAYSGKVNTKDILFVFGGAFSGLEKIIEQRTAHKGIGFNAPVKTKQAMHNIIEKVCVKDFTDYGMLPEFMGRLTTIATLKELTEEDLFKIFTEPKQCILQQLVNEFYSFGVNINFTSDAVEYLVKEALKLKIGARGLKSVSQQILRPVYYALSSIRTHKTVILTKQMLEDSEEFYYE